MEITYSDFSAISSLLKERKAVFVVADNNVRQFAEQLDFPTFFINATEQDKCMESVMSICGWLLENGAGRDAFLLGIGGGITTDITGFVASIYKRGIGFGFVPTTLLSQVDASLGGKNGVNFKGLKNMIGRIGEPEFTLISTETLKSLPEKVFKEGIAEIVKTFILDEDWMLYDKAISLFDSQSPTEILSSKSSIQTLDEVVKAAGAVKMSIVERDLHEKGERRKLNLGHTFAHAIESLSKGEISHGEAVSMGIVLAARLSLALELCEEDFVEMLGADLEACGLPVDCPFSVNEMISAMKADKKAEGGIIHFVLPVDIGDVRITDLTAGRAAELLTD